MHITDRILDLLSLALTFVRTTKTRVPATNDIAFNFLYTLEPQATSKQPLGTYIPALSIGQVLIVCGWGKVFIVPVSETLTSEDDSLVKQIIDGIKSQANIKSENRDYTWELRPLTAFPML